MSSFLFHDYETFGADTKRSRASQYASIRTDKDLNEIGTPVMIYTKMQEDTLPSPTACMITKIGPSEVDEKGIPEVEFIKIINKEMSQPKTCTLGYNTIQFDDEITRNTLYRNLLDPYEREFKNGCTRWDIIDVVRLSVALYPDILKLGERNGKASYKLEDLSQENGILHESAHDALSDVRATIGIAKIIKEKQSKLFDILYEKRTKQKVLESVNSGLPLLIASSFFGIDKKYADFILPIVENPNNKNEYYCVKLSKSKEDINELINAGADKIKSLLFSSNEVLLDQEVERPGLHVLKINKCPVLVDSNDLKALFPTDAERHAVYSHLSLDMDQIIESYKFIKSNKVKLKDVLLKVFAPIDYPKLNDPDIRIYDGFPDNADKRQFGYFHTDLEKGNPFKHLSHSFKDPRYNEMVFRAIVRNYPEMLDKMPEMYRDKWYEHCFERLNNRINDSVQYSFKEFFEEIDLLRTDERYLDSSYQDVLDELKKYGEDLQQKYKDH